MKKVSLLGLGYVGLPTLVAIAKIGKYDLVGYDIDKEKIKKLKAGQSYIEDKDVEIFLKNNSCKNILFSKDDKSLSGSDIFIIAVPTPVNDNHQPDYTPVKSASKAVRKYLKKGVHVVLESTVNPGTCEEIVIPILEKNSELKAGKDFNIAHCPERINPGDKKWNIYNINRNIGSINEKLNKEIAQFYRSFITDAQVNEVSCLKVAEATKIVENTFRDINIAFVNELAQSFDRLGIDLHETLQASSNKPFAFMPHWPGCGVGGHCIAVDPYYLIRRAQKSGFNHRFLKLAREINNYMPDYCVQRLTVALNEVGLPIKGTKVTLLGLSYKPNVGDLRESPSLEIEKKLKKLEADLTVYDPYINRGAKTLEEAVRSSQALVLATAHSKIVQNIYRLLKNSSVKVILDGRNALDKEKIEKEEILYQGIGH